MPVIADIYLILNSLQSALMLAKACELHLYSWPKLK